MAGPIRIGIIGLGRAGWGMHCPELNNVKDLFQIVAVCDTIPDRLQKAKDAYGCATYEKVPDMLADSNVELFDVASRSCDHYAHATAALKTGKHVLIEKPMTTTYAEARRLSANAAKAKGRLFVRHNRRYEPGFQHIREIMASGILGEVYEIKLRRMGFARRDDWQTIKKYGGGQLLNWGPHIVDHALRLLESPVADQWSNLRRIAAVGDAEDHLQIILRGKNGRVVDLEISGGAALGQPEYFVLGTLGALTCVGETIHLKYLDPDKPLSPRKANPATPESGFGSADQLAWIEKTMPVSPAKKVDMGLTIWQDLHAAIRRRAKYPITIDEAVGVMQVISNAKKGTKFA